MNIVRTFFFIYNTLYQCFALVPSIDFLIEKVGVRLDRGLSLLVVNKCVLTEECIFKALRQPMPSTLSRVYVLVDALATSINCIVSS